jgi:acyl dehydratase
MTGGGDQAMPFTAPERERYFEDYEAGAVHQLGQVRVDGLEMVEFARAYDPQDIHVNAGKAAAGPFQGLIASGWFTASLMMRFLARHYLSNGSSLGSPGIDALRWLAPVRPDDHLIVRVSILETRRSKSKPGRGIVKSLIEVLNQDGVVVMDLRGVNLIAARQKSGN